MNSQVPYSARVQAGGFFLCHALTPTFSGSSGLFHLSSAYTVAKGRTAFSLYRMNLDRNPKDLDASTHPLAVPKFIPYRPTTDFPFFGQPQQ